MLPTIILGIALLLSCTAICINLESLIKHKYTEYWFINIFLDLSAVIFWCIFYYLIH